MLSRHPFSGHYGVVHRPSRGICCYGGIIGAASPKIPIKENGNSHSGVLPEKGMRLREETNIENDCYKPDGNLRGQGRCGMTFNAYALGLTLAENG
jgi:hypothetical protein